MESKRDVKTIGGREEGGGVEGMEGGGVEGEEGGGACSEEEDEVMYLVSVQCL